MNYHRARVTYSLVAALIFLVLFILLSFCVPAHSAGHHVITIIDGFNKFVPHSALIQTIAVTVTHLADPVSVLITGLIVLLIMAVVHERFEASLLLAGLVIGGIGGIILKNNFVRARPTDVLFLVPRSGYAYPSNHALVATIFFGFLGYCLYEATKTKKYRIAIAVITFLIILAVGLSRIILGVHWPSDVLGGWLLGGAILSLLITSYHLGHTT